MKRNIVLIGLSGCGKSTVGRALAKNLHKTFVDMDDYIEKKEGMPVSKIFEKKGEAYFRALETETAETLSAEEGKIIATGGGVVLFEQNMEYLKKNGLIVFLDRSPETILKKINLKKRPLLAQNQNRLFEMDKKRRPLYEKYAELTVLGAPSVPETAERLKEALKSYLSEK
ncbi:MAG: shikimate kinase [Clostridia bacterium]|nr:shikimate kinase [Clostridia bacterium]